MDVSREGFDINNNNTGRMELREEEVNKQLKDDDSTENKGGANKHPKSNNKKILDALHGIERKNNYK